MNRRSARSAEACKLAAYVGDYRGRYMATLMNKLCPEPGMAFAEPDVLPGGWVVGNVIVCYNSSNWKEGHRAEFSDSVAMLNFDRSDGIPRIEWERVPPGEATDDASHRRVYLLSKVAAVLSTMLVPPDDRYLKPKQ